MELVCAQVSSSISLSILLPFFRSLWPESLGDLQFLALSNAGTTVRAFTTVAASIASRRTSIKIARETKEVCPCDAKRYSPSRLRSSAPLIRLYFSLPAARAFRFYDRRVWPVLSVRLRFFLGFFHTFRSSNCYATARFIAISAVKFYIDFRSPSLETSFEISRGRNNDILLSSPSWDRKKNVYENGWMRGPWYKVTIVKKS